MAEWLVARRGLAFSESNSQSTWQLVNVLQSNLAIDSAARLAQKTGEATLADTRRKEFEAAWPGPVYRSRFTGRGEPR